MARRDRGHVWRLLCGRRLLLVAEMIKPLLLLVGVLTLFGCADMRALHELSLQAQRDHVSAFAGDVVYHESECVGAVVNGICHGSVMPEPRYHERCYGPMLAGECVGAQF